MLQSMGSQRVGHDRATELNRLLPARLLCPLDSPGKNTGVGCHFLLQGIFLIQTWNLGLLSALHWPAESLPLHHWEAVAIILKAKGRQVLPYMLVFDVFGKTCSIDRGLNRVHPSLLTAWPTVLGSSCDLNPRKWAERPAPMLLPSPVTGRPTLSPVRCRWPCHSLSFYFVILNILPIRVPAELLLFVFKEDYDIFKTIFLLFLNCEPGRRNIPSLLN